jgi:hypothetical protein
MSDLLMLARALHDGILRADPNPAPDGEILEFDLLPVDEREVCVAGVRAVIAEMVEQELIPYSLLESLIAAHH